MSGSRKTVLVVEDSEEIRALLDAALRNSNVNVVMASTGQEALTYLALNKPSLMLLDLTLPDMSIDEYLAAQRALLKANPVPTVLTSGRHDIREHAKAMNAEGYLKKPYGLSELLEVVSKYCGT